MARQIARPRPTPEVADSRSPRVNFSKIASSCPSAEPGPLSRHRDQQILARGCGREPHRAAGRRVLGGVLQQIAQHALDQHGIELDQRQLAVEVDLDAVV